MTMVSDAVQSGIDHSSKNQQQISAVPTEGQEAREPAEPDRTFPGLTSQVLL
jgi:hypothetical protein